MKKNHKNSFQNSSDLPNKKNKFKKELEKLDFKAFLIDREKEIWEPVFKSILEEEAKITGIDAKIKYLNEKIQKYLQEASSQTIVTSGTILNDSMPMPLFMHKALLDRIAELKLNKGVHQTDLNYKDKHWFIVGVAFADGTIHKFATELGWKSDNMYSTPKFRQIAIKLGNENYKNTISESWNRNTNEHNNKNIFSDRYKLDKIIEHCKENNIPIVESFKP